MKKPIDYGNWKFESRVLQKKFEDLYNARKEFGFVYQITNIETGEFYIGKKCVLTKRRIKGKRKIISSDWRGYRGSSKAFQRFVEKAGVDAFDFRIIELHEHKRELAINEALLILKTIEDKRSWNQMIALKVVYRKNLKIK